MHALRDLEHSESSQAHWPFTLTRADAIRHPLRHCSGHPHPAKQAREELVDLLLMPSLTQRDGHDEVLCFLMYRVPVPDSSVRFRDIDSSARLRDIDLSVRFRRIFQKREVPLEAEEPRPENGEPLDPPELTTLAPASFGFSLLLLLPPEMGQVDA
jgi:hypothetical protein